MVKDTNIASDILNAAQQRFARFGLIKTTMVEIANDIGMSKASLYYYFTDKETIFKEVIKKEQDEFLEKISDLISKETGTEKLLITYVTNRLEIFKNFLNLGKLSSENLKGVKPILSILFEDFKKKEIQLITRILKKGIETGELRTLNLSEHAELFIALLRGLRSNVLLKQKLEDLTKKDHAALEKQTVLATKIFSNGIKKY